MKTKEPTMDKLKMQSPNLVEANIDKIAALFPNCITESRDENGIVQRSVDFDLLRQELSPTLVEGPQERYTLNWPGKNEAILTANAPIAKTLRPCEEESVDFANTRNIFIEGDNLDALKLLQETYLGKVKMIYIDPPYNTGNDFIYEDDFAENTVSFLQRSNQTDEQGNRLIANSDSNGRFHSDWLSMLYPRLKLARNLLRDDGVIYISIDDGEVHNIRKMCDEAFGESNFVANVIWEKKFSPQNDAKWLSDNHDHILIYAKNKEIWRPFKLPRTDENNARFSNPDNDPRGPWASSDMTVKTYNANYDYPIMSPSGTEICPTKGRCWAMPKKKFDELIADQRVWFGVNGNNVPRYKTFLSELTDGIVPLTIWKYTEVGHNQEARQELKKLFVDHAYFDGPKPTRLLKRVLVLSTRNDDIVLDFFSGSATTAHAVMAQNSEDVGNRKFIMVQLPELCDEKSEAYKAGYKTIAEIAKERIRRAGKKIKEENPAANNLDTGFRVFKVDTSNMQDVYYTPDQLKQENLELFKDHIKPDRRPEDLLFQVFIDWGLDLSLPIAKETIDGKNVFIVDTDALVACFDTGITEELVKKLAQYKPLRVVFRDDAFGSDSVKINVEQIFKLLSPGTEVKSI